MLQFLFLRKNYEFRVVNKLFFMKNILKCVQVMIRVLLDQPLLHSLKGSLWTHSSVQQSRMADLQGDFRHCRLQTNKQSFSLREEDEQVLDRRTMAVKVLDEYAGYAPVLNHEFYT